MDPADRQLNRQRDLLRQAQIPIEELQLTGVGGEAHESIRGRLVCELVERAGKHHAAFERPSRLNRASPSCSNTNRSCSGPANSRCRGRFAAVSGRDSPVGGLSICQITSLVSTRYGCSGVRDESQSRRRWRD